MKTTVYALNTIFILLSVTVSRAGFADNAKHIVFDLDGVVLFHVPQDSNGQNIIAVKSDTSEGGDVASSEVRYRVADGFPETLLWLEKNGWRVSVFSFGNRTRNVSALKAIPLPDGRNALELIRHTKGRVLSNTDGLNLDPNDKRTTIDTSLPKEQRPKIVKSLKHVFGAESANALLVEDILQNAAPGERETQTIFLPYKWVIAPDGREVKFLESNQATFVDALHGNNFEKAGESATRFHRLRNRMAYLVGLLDHVESKAERHGMSLSESLQDTQWLRTAEGDFQLEDGTRVFKDALLDSSLVGRGAELLEAVPTGNYSMVHPVSVENFCRRSFEALDAFAARRNFSRAYN